MHIPDGFLDIKSAATTAVISAGGLTLAFNRMKRQLPREKIPLMGLSAAFIFAAQMINFPVAGGTSGHLIGGVLAAVLLGTNAAVVVLAAVIIVQSLLFADGGILALGANILNMACVAPVVGAALYRIVQSLLPGIRGRLLAAGFASWCSTVVAAACAAGELAWAGTAPWAVAFPAMFQVHMVIGVGEGVITMLVLSAIHGVRPELLEERQTSRRDMVAFVGYGTVVILALLLFVLPFASPWPDGLERVAALFGFDRKAALGGAPLAGYRLPGMDNLLAATALSGLIGATVVFAFAYLLARLLVRGKSPVKS